MQALEKLAKSEGILCAIETAHAFAGACDWGRAQVAAGRRPEDLVIVVNTSGRGDKDVDTAARWFGLVSAEEIAEAQLAKADDDAAEGTGAGEGW
jgi:tryptophan synthase beta chain